MSGNKGLSNLNKQAFELARGDYLKIQSTMTDQYILTQFLGDLVKQSEEGKIPSAPHSGVTVPLRRVDPYELCTLLTRSGDSLAHRNVFNTFNNAQLSFLTPEIKMVIRKRSGSGTTLHSIPLQNIQPKMKIFESVEKSTALIGLKNINLEFAGQHYATARNDINATATFYGNTLAAFEKHPIYQNLILPPIATEGTDNSAPSEVEVLLHVGWALPSKEAEKSLNFTEIQMQALTAQFQSFVMMYTGHSFSFNQDGSFILNVNYVSMIDEILTTANYITNESFAKRVFGKSGDKSPDKPLTPKVSKFVSKFIEANYSAAKPETKTMVRNALLVRGPDKVSEQIEIFKRRQASLAPSEFAKMFEDLRYKYLKIKRPKLNLLFLKKALKRYVPNISNSNISTLVAEIATDSEFNAREFYTNAEAIRISGLKIAGKIDEFAEFLGAGKNITGKRPPNAIREAMSPALQQPTYLTREQFLKETVIDPKDDEIAETKYIPFTTVGYFIQTFLSKVKHQISGRDIKVVLGTLKVSIPGDIANKKVYSIFDIPIAEQSIKEVIRKLFTGRVTERVTFLAFMRVLMEEVVEKYYIQGDFVFDAGLKRSSNIVRTAQFTIPEATASKINSSTIKKGFRQDIRSLATVENPPESVNLYFVTAGPAADPSELLLDNYVVSSPNSVIKKINYTESNIAIIAEKRNDLIAKAYRDGNLEILPQVYNVKMDIVGNMMFIPGYVFNLWPNTMGLSAESKDSVLKKLGLLGSYWTIGVEHSFGEGGFTTTIDAYNVTVGESPTR